MKYGFYISPWDCNSPLYGTDNYVTEVFLKQCEELAAYGDEQFEMWFDGAKGGRGYYGGTTLETRTVDRAIYYDVPNLRYRVHERIPDCVLWGVGGEARWIGNEEGWAGETNWAMTDYGGSGVKENGDINGWFWHPGESDAKATSLGWFWHNGESIKNAERLFQMYLETVGRNATLILNCPPDQSGSLPDYTVTELARLGQLLHSRLALPVEGLNAPATDYAKTATIEVDKTRTAGANRNYEKANLIDGNKDTYWGVNDGEHSATITLTWDTPQTIRYLVMQEPIKLGQRIKEFKIEYSEDGAAWTELCPVMQTTTVGYKRIIPLNGKTNESYGNGYKAKQLRITIEDSRACPLLSNLNVY